jgi:hypothetical protein
MGDHFMVESQFGQANESANICAENLTPSEAHCGIFSELGGCAHLVSS